MKKVVVMAMKKHPAVASRFAYLVMEGKLKSNKDKTKDPEQEILPGCANKYHLIGKERIIVVLCLLYKGFNEKSLGDMCL